MNTLGTTALTAWHAAHGARMVDFAGWTMPVHYASIIDEHLATRRVAGLFDVSHMGRLVVAGPAARFWLESLLTRQISDLEPGHLRYTLLTRGGDDMAAAAETGAYVILDDAIVGRDADGPDGAPRLKLVVNASNRRRVFDWLTSQLPAAGVSLADETLATAMIAIQGPLAVELVSGLCPTDDAVRVAALGTYRSTTATVAGQAAAVSRTGYTGEDGLEIVVPRSAAELVWQTILDAGRPLGLAACGLGARDTLRLEAGMPLFGHELTDASDPFALGLGFAVTLDRRPGGEPRSFPGSEALRCLRAVPAPQVRVGLAFAGKRAAREGSEVVKPGTAGRAVGSVTSGSFAPSLGHAVAMALVDRDLATPGTRLDVLLRGEPQAARVVPLPFWHRQAVDCPAASRTDS